ncbi:LAMI_0C01420g1_1 [Lachancea mirantina]|uniref:LAMI_0C01420g1_1 n=1 Tax=Lachancea mirantina TaxID=1230905 RepID=A0A1G4J060_9SACH|nr:LAMI_0C01420g1_1 [Lachancea mirantina]
MSNATGVKENARQQNKLTACFDEIMKLSAEMLVQQQMKTIQLSSDMIKGFSHNQQKLLGEKIHMFHTILDDVDLTLSSSQDFVNRIAGEAVKKKQDKIKEEERLRLKDEEEARKREEMNKKVTNTVHSDMGGPAAGENLTFGEEPDAKNGSSMPSNFGDLNDFGLSMFGGIESNDLLAEFNTNTNAGLPAGNNEEDNKPNMIAMNQAENKNEVNSNNQNMDNNPDSYLTLNDFNDLGLDWNGGDGQNELDMNEFNI